MERESETGREKNDQTLLLMENGLRLLRFWRFSKQMDAHEIICLALWHKHNYIMNRWQRYNVGYCPNRFYRLLDLTCYYWLVMSIVIDAHYWKHARSESMDNSIQWKRQMKNNLEKTNEKMTNHWIHSINNVQSNSHRVGWGGREKGTMSTIRIKLYVPDSRGS